VFPSVHVTGRLEEIFAEPGLAVERGQILAQLVSPELQILQLDLLLARLRHRSVSARVERLATLSNVTARQELWQAQADQDRLTLETADLARRLKLIGLTEEQINALRPTDAQNETSIPLVTGVPIVAPISGTVAEFDVVPGQVISSEDQPLEVLNSGTIWVRGFAREQEADTVSRDAHVDVSIPALGDEKRSGKIIRLAPAMAEGTRVLPFWVELDNADGRLLPGMMGTIIVPLPTDTDRPTNPRLTVTE
jgi:cobalt-zinc-cadmium efflux system membrane fusion protein